MGGGEGGEVREDHDVGAPTRRDEAEIGPLQPHRGVQRCRADRFDGLHPVADQPAEHIVDAAVLTAYDNYYYSRHPERGERSLPVIRVRFADPEHTWFHLDPLTGEVIERSTRTNRIYRWLYNGLHSFDIWWLWQRRPLWDLCVIAFSLGGLLLSCIGVTIGWRRLRPLRSRNVDIRVAAEGGIR